MEIKPISISSVNSRFENFARQSVQNPQKVDLRYFNSQLGILKTQYKKFGKLDLFVDKMVNFAELLQAKDHRNMAGVVYSGLAKLPIPTKRRITILERAIENSEALGDKSHVLGRIVDLKNLYKTEGMPKEYLKTLLKEEKCLKGIVMDFEEAQKGFKSISKDSKDEYVYRYNLAQVRIDFGKTCMRQNPKLALSKIKNAKRFFDAQGCTDDSLFAQVLIEKIESRKSRHTKRIY